MNNLQLVDYVKKVQSKGNDTVYILGGIGRKLTNDFIDRRIKMGDKLAKNNEKLLRANVGKYSYDCVGLIKSFLWTNNKPFAAITYNAKQDQNVSMMWNAAKEKGRMDTWKRELGTLVMTDDLGHVGVYIGKENGKDAFIECTVTGGSWKVIKSYGYTNPKIAWSRWAKYSLIDYVAETKPITPAKKSNEEVAKEVMNGDWGNGAERKKRLTEAGYNYDEVQAIVNGKGKPTPPAKKTNAEIAEEVKLGKWGNGAERKKRLTDAGYDYDAIQKIVNASSKPVPLKKGDKVKVLNNVQYTGGRFKQWHDVYDVMENQKGDRVVIGKKGVIHAAVNAVNLKKV